jgi:glycosyltransferase involved in cell wall biosynthesis
MRYREKSGFEKKNIVLIMPAYNEAKKIGSVISGLKKSGYHNIIVVNDGSADATSALAEKSGAIVVNHFLNRGLGGALGTGISAALKLTSASVFVTFDSDGQHDPSDIEKVVKPIFLREADCVIGSRLINPEGMPWIRRFGNWQLNILTFLLFGKMVSDSQSGLRAFSRSAAKKIRIQTNTMEVSSEIISLIAENNLKLREVPIKAIYSEYSLSKGQTNLNGFKIVFKLFVEWLRG